VANVSRRFRVTGRVQGVYFRQSTRAQAERLALFGYARNLPDGSVEVLAHGKIEAIQELERWLSQGPSSARVDAVLEIELESAPSPTKFQVL
jgi:acylphosphatase